jgi:hypothetical protein
MDGALALQTEIPSHGANDSRSSYRREAVTGGAPAT